MPKVRSSREGGQLFWQQVAETERLPVEPDAMFTLRFADRPADDRLSHFFFEADRGTMAMTDMLKKLRGYYHFIEKQQRHREAFGIHPVRAVLVETTDEPRGRRLMELVNHPLMRGPTKRAGLFWFTISPLFTDPAEGTFVPAYLCRPEIILDSIWALPDRTLRALSDKEVPTSCQNERSRFATNNNAKQYVCRTLPRKKSRRDHYQCLMLDQHRDSHRYQNRCE